MPIVLNQSVPNVRCDLQYRAELYSTESGKTPAVRYAFVKSAPDS
jgi:hypothetical protein